MRYSFVHKMFRRSALSLAITVLIACNQLLRVAGGGSKCVFCDPTLTVKFMECLKYQLTISPIFNGTPRDALEDMQASLLAASGAMTRTQDDMKMKIMAGAMGGEMAEVILLSVHNIDVSYYEAMTLSGNCYREVTGYPGADFMALLGQSVQSMLSQPSQLSISPAQPYQSDPEALRVQQPSISEPSFSRGYPDSNTEPFPQNVNDKNRNFDQTVDQVGPSSPQNNPNNVVLVNQPKPLTPMNTPQNFPQSFNQHFADYRPNQIALNDNAQNGNPNFQAPDGLINTQVNQQPISPAQPHQPDPGALRVQQPSISEPSFSRGYPDSNTEPFPQNVNDKNRNFDQTVDQVGPSSPQNNPNNVVLVNQPKPLTPLNTPQNVGQPDSATPLAPTYSNNATGQGATQPIPTVLQIPTKPPITPVPPTSAPQLSTDSPKACAMKFAEMLYFKLLQDDRSYCVLGTNTPHDLAVTAVSIVISEGLSASGYPNYSTEASVYARKQVDSLPKRATTQAYVEKVAKATMTILYKYQELTSNCAEKAKFIAENMLYILPMISDILFPGTRGGSNPQPQTPNKPNITVANAGPVSSQQVPTDRTNSNTTPNTPPGPVPPTKAQSDPSNQNKTPNKPNKLSNWYQRKREGNPILPPSKNTEPPPLPTSPGQQPLLGGAPSDPKKSHDKPPKNKYKSQRSGKGTPTRPLSTSTEPPPLTISPEQQPRYGSPWQGSQWQGSQWQRSPWQGSQWQRSPRQGYPWQQPQLAAPGQLPPSEFPNIPLGSVPPTINTSTNGGQQAPTSTNLKQTPDKGNKSPGIRLPWLRKFTKPPNSTLGSSITTASDGASTVSYTSVSAPTTGSQGSTTVAPRLVTTPTLTQNSPLAGKPNVSIVSAPNSNPQYQPISPVDPFNRPDSGNPSTIVATATVQNNPSSSRMDPLQILMKASRDSISPNGFNYNYFVKMVTSVALKIGKDHPESSPDQIMLKTYMLAIVALSEVLQGFRTSCGSTQPIAPAVNQQNSFASTHTAFAPEPVSAYQAPQQLQYGYNNNHAGNTQLQQFVFPGGQQE